MRVKEKYTQVDILVNNAGFISLDRQETKEGVERQFGINHLGHFLLTTQLIDMMKPGSRIVVVASGAHKVGKIHFDDVFSGYSYDGVPDTRVIVFQGFPVMCMMRLSTAASDGKANLHQGAVGVGICVRTGRAVRAVQHNEPIETHPDTEKQLSLLKVPHWQEVLELASSCYDMSGLGYIGTDIVLDRDRGPMLLELNARPGMAIQICNNAGLLPRLRLIEAMTKKHRLSVKERVAFSMNHFGVFKD